MKVKNAKEIRSTFLQFFQKHGHQIVPSGPLVPQNDPTLMFTNAGMVPFKDVFTGKETRDYKRATSSQKCLRVSGKHNDLEEVGRTARHQTLFEMLGNFSFGDYFKEEAIVLAHELLSKTFQIDTDRLVYTVFGGDKDLQNVPPDEEAKNLWKKIANVSDDKIIGLGKKDNFWQMGETGPCGPNSEIHFFQSDALPCEEEAMGRKCLGVACECDRWLEIWNLVFMQFERNEDESLIALPSPCVDTGMGFERLCTILSGEISAYHTDLFQPLLEKVSALCQKRYNPDPKVWDSDDNVSMRVIADHARATAFCIADGVLPGNTGRGYVLRRIMRRAMSHSRLLGIEKPFFEEVIHVVIAQMNEAYPELLERKETILHQVNREEKTFRATYDRSYAMLEKLENDLENPKIWTHTQSGLRILSGDEAFRLKDTYGCPLELMSALGKRHNFQIDEEGFERKLQEQISKSRSAQKLGGTAVKETYKELLQTVGTTEFLGYETSESKEKIAAILLWTETEKTPTLSLIKEAKEGDDIEIIARRTPFYGEAGGQVGDRGQIASDHGIAIVSDTQKPGGDLIVHQATVQSGVLRIDDIVSFQVDDDNRKKIRSAHSATHLLHYALKQTLGSHIAQIGSKVEAERLRFDFTHDKVPSSKELQTIETIVNRMVFDNRKTQTEILPIEEAKKKGAVAIFEEKYGETVRALHIHNTFELCGGTHVNATGDIGLFKIVSSTPIGAGKRRLEALTGNLALAWTQKEETILQKAANLLKGTPEELPERIEQLQEEMSHKEQQLKTVQNELAAQKADDIFTQVKTIDDFQVLAAKAPFGNPKDLREFGDRVRDKVGSGVFLLAGVDGNKVTLLCMVTKDLSKRFHAGKLIREVAEEVGGRGGGKAEMAQAGGNQPENLDKALQKFLTKIGA